MAVPEQHNLNRNLVISLEICASCVAATDAKVISPAPQEDLIEHEFSVAPLTFNNNVIENIKINNKNTPLFIKVRYFSYLKIIWIYQTLL